MLYELPTQISCMICGHENVLYTRQVKMHCQAVKCCMSGRCRHTQQVRHAGQTAGTNILRKRLRTALGTDAEQAAEAADADTIRSSADLILND